MSTATTSPPAEAPKSSLASTLLMALLPLIAGAAGAAVPLYLNMTAQPAVEEAPEEVPVSKETVVIPFGEIVSNLSEGRMNRYLRLRISMLVSKPHKMELETKLQTEGPLMKNWLLSLVSDKSVEDIRGRSGQNMLRREMRDHFNEVLCPDGRDLVYDVLFEEFNVQ